MSPRASDHPTQTVFSFRRIRFIVGLTAITLMVGAGSAGLAAQEPATTDALADTYQPTAESLAAHDEAPEWLRDAKIGIYFHWGVYSVPAYGSEWYPRNMHLPNRHEYRHHVKTYGQPSEFGYHDFVKDFTAEHFDASEWAELFEKTGARFAGPVAEHHDGFSMWDSEITPWNAADMGPKRDITGQLADALRERDMKLITTFHHARHLQRNKEPLELDSEPGKKIDFKNLPGFDGASHYPFFKGQPPTSDDPKLAMLYGNMPEEKWLEEVWLGKLKEVIARYQPDIIWFDSWLDRIPEEVRFEFAAHYLNEAKKWGREVVIVRKQEDLPLSFSILDHEKARTSGASKDVWMTDDTISTGSWCYTNNLKVKPAADVIHATVDTVSKNGIVLLNISPKADGSIPDDQRKTMLELGEWLETHAQAIYGTRPWITFGEGPTKEPTGGFKEHKKFLKLKYSAKDVRYTASKDGKLVFATLLGKPEAGSTVELKSFVDFDGKVAGVAALPIDGGIDFERAETGTLSFTVPEGLPSEAANVFVIAVE